MIDFDAIRNTLNAASRQLDGELDAAAIADLLRDRARSLAARNLSVPRRKEFARVIVVRRGDTWLGFPLERIQEIRYVDVAPLPRATPVVPGIFHIRGQIHSLVDLLPLLEEGAAISPPGSTFTILITSEAGPIGLRVDEVAGLRIVYADECDVRKFQNQFIRGVTLDLLQVVEVDPLLAHPSISIDIAD